MHNSPYFAKLDKLLYDIKLIELSNISENMIYKTELITIKWKIIKVYQLNFLVKKYFDLLIMMKFEILDFHNLKLMVHLCVIFDKKYYKYRLWYGKRDK